jgi:RNA 3'-phosphate cyclase
VPVLALDGGLGEGGGQLLRTALALSSVTRQPFHMVHVRANRPQPGLRPQHAALARAFASLTGGRVKGADVGATEVTFEPGTMAGGELHADIGTAGSVPLFIEALLPALACSGSFWRIHVTGGTDGKWAPPWDYVARVHVDTLERMGWRPRAKLVRRGWWPRGGGGAILEAGPWEPRPFSLTRAGKPWRIHGRVAISNLPDQVAARVRNSALGRLAERGYGEAEVDVTGSPALDPGVAITLWADDGRCLLGASALGEQGKPSEVVGREAADGLLAELDGGGSVDTWASDQLMVYGALAAPKGRSSYAAREATAHARTNAEVLEAFLPIRVAFEGEKPIRVTIEAR